MKQARENQAFVVEAPELPGCMADGATYLEAVANTEKVIVGRVQIATEPGHPIPGPRGRLMYA